MLAQIVFLHIEKSAGTSQWRLFEENYGKNNIFRRDIEIEALRTREIADIDDRIVVGGHVTLDSFRKSPRRCLYVSVVREPVSRAISLFHYFAENAPEKDRRIWKKKGLDSGSMLNTIETVSEFREAINEGQCYRLSGAKNYQAVREALEQHNFVVGCFDNVEAFNLRLKDLLNWTYASLGRHNIAPLSNYQDKILEEPGLKERIIELAVEDRKLYQFIAERECYYHVPDEESFRTHLSASPDNEAANSIEVEDLKHIKLELYRKNPLIIETQAAIRLRLVNDSERPLLATGNHPIRVSFHWYDVDGQLVEWEGTRSKLPKHVYPRERLDLTVNVTVPKTLPSGKYRIRFGLLELGKRWLETVDDSHTASTEVNYKGRAEWFEA